MAFQDFDYISERRKNERKEKMRKRIIIASVSSVVLLLLITAAVCAVVYNNKGSDKSGPSAGKTSKPSASPSVKAVKAICAPTDYKETCESSLGDAVKSKLSTTQPKDLFQAAIRAIDDKIAKALNQTLKGIKFDNPEKKAAFDVCTEVLNDATEELKSSVEVVGEDDLKELKTRAPDLSNWLSAALSYQHTCIDAMPEGESKVEVQKALKTAKELSSNSLAILAEVTTLLTTFQTPNGSKRGRRLLATEENRIPAWVNREDRRVLKADDVQMTPNVTVAKDGSGNFTTINDALAALPAKYTGRYVIYVKEGVYDENVKVEKNMVNITMYGDGSQKSMITGSKNYVDGVPTFQTATFAAIGEGFMAQFIGFRNTAGPEKHQAVALRVQSDRSIFQNCRMEGYQDTLYAQTHRQFYRGCYITGTVDFIFGDAAAVFQNCMIYVRKPMDNQQNIVTAQGRTDKRETTGIVLQNCRILADETLEPEKAKFKSYLGRPWKEFSRTIVMESEIGDLIDPEGWLRWNASDFGIKTASYAEFNNKGPGADVKGRIKWAGYKLITKKDEALKFTVSPFIQGDSWLKPTEVDVRFGLS